MAETICFDRSTFYKVIFLGLAIIGFVLYRVHKAQYTEFTENIKSSINELISQQSQEEEIDTHTAHAANVITTQASEDRRRMHDPFVPPVSRGPFSYSGTALTMPIGMPTRGEYGPFQQLGYLYNSNNNDQAMPVMGRRIHSQQYEYYTFHHNNPNIKIPIGAKNGRELYDGNSVNVSGYQTTFTFKKYELDHPRYIPY